MTRSASCRAETTIAAVAHYLLWFARQHGDAISSLKLQKLLFYAQGWFLALHNRPLFQEEMQAWVHGPANYGLWKKYRAFTWQPITEVPTREPRLAPVAAEHLKEIWRVFGRYSAYDLELMTHREAPWIEARADLPLDAPSDAIISKKAMKRHFKAVMHGQEPRTS